MANEDQSTVPNQVREKLVKFHESLDELEEFLEPLFTQSMDEIERNLLDPLTKARLELMSMFATNSLFWLWIRLGGDSPDDHHQIYEELKRIRAGMDRMKEIAKDTAA